ncbi:MAG TPA: 2-polyprenylphenol 6-hydroxylase [Alphaproteobacteria bacterium]|nr:2-polyprenylphenol 6-hydroxylase [Alphaproteobacteria bacterium]
MVRALRNLGRVTHIALTLARHDALIGVERLGLPRVCLAALSRLRGTGLPARPGERLAAALTELGPSFVKLGQALSTRADLVGEDVAADLSELQDKLAPFPSEAARATIVAELGRPLESLFESFDDRAVAAASIAQVHFATARDADGRPREVAIKVLRPDIEALFQRDLDLIAWLAELAERYAPSLNRLKPVEVARTVAETVRLEMDLRLEAAAASELAENFKGDADFRVPAVDWSRTSRRVLTLARIAGIPIDERQRLVAAGHDPDDIVAKAARAFFNQVFRDGFFHADMHPGNLFVAEDGALVAVDFGIMGRLDRSTRNYLADMLLGFLNGDYKSVAEVHFRAGFVPASQSVGAFMQACRAIAEPILGRPLNEISLARLLAQLFQVTKTFQMETQPQLLLLQKSMLVCEGVGRKLNPDVNMWSLARPLIETWMHETRGVEARTRVAAADALARIEELPGFVANVEKAAAMLAEGGVRLHQDAIAALGGGRSRGAMWPWVALAFLAGLGLAASL